MDGHVFPRSWPDAFRIGAFHRVPLMIGVTEHEGRRVYAELLQQMGLRPLGEDDYRPALLGLSGTPELADAALREFPLRDDGRSVSETLADVGTWAHYTCPHAELADAVGPFAPTWLYEFRVPGPRSDDAIELGAYHGADTELLFGAGPRAPIPALDGSRAAAAATLRAYVANFVRSGDPNGPDLPQWPRHARNGGARQWELDASPAAATGLRERACRFWRRVEWPLLPAVP